MLPAREQPAPMRSFSLPRLVSSPAPFVSHIANKMPHQVATLILGVVTVVALVYAGQFFAGPVEAWMRQENFSIAVGFNTTVQFYWRGGVIERDLAPFRIAFPRDQVAPAA
ncbi:hypothetical protein EDB85DRAFT_1901812 [Lactarius pseudohatsudake]|nr:hypothetical protein EDB85DRAFT_1901812 [Lactarius pseudohatsudake]